MRAARPAPREGARCQGAGGSRRNDIRAWQYGLSQHRLADVRERLTLDGPNHPAHQSGVASVAGRVPLLQAGLDDQAGVRPALFQDRAVEAENLDSESALFAEPLIAAHRQSEQEVIERVLGSRVYEKRLALGVHWELVTLLMAVASRAGQQMVQPVEGAWRVARDRLEVIDACTSALAAVHALLKSWCHVSKHLTEWRMNTRAGAGPLPDTSGIVGASLTSLVRVARRLVSSSGRDTRAILIIPATGWMREVARPLPRRGPLANW